MVTKKHQKGDPLVTFENFGKISHRAKNTVREYPLVPLNSLDDVKKHFNLLCNLLNLLTKIHES